MAFTEYGFLLFFAVTLLVYYVIPKKVQWVWLLVASIFFYLQSLPVFLVFFGSSIVVSYLAALLMQKNNDKATQCKNEAVMKKLKTANTAISASAIVLNAGVLCYTKYINFAAENIMNLIGGDYTAIDVIVPLGISFYTFQIIGYCADVCSGSTKAEKNIFKFALFMSFFPQILQGPIAKFDDLAPQLYRSHTFEYEKVKSGALRMLWGFFKKMVIADRAAMLADQVYGNWGNYDGFIIAIAAVFYMLQLYADFSGCMDIAIGAGETFGITMTENFNMPFFSKSVPEFWRRWHASLGKWFKNYIYIPMGGNRCSKIRAVFNLAVVWLVTGIWHGSSWNYVAWGIYFGILVILSKLLQKPIAALTEKLKINTNCISFSIFRMLRTIILVCFGFIFFRANGLISALNMIKNMVTEYNPWVFFDGTMLTLGIDGKNMNVLIAAVLVMVLVSIANYRGIRIREELAKQNILCRWLVYIVGIMSVLIFGIYGSSYDASAFIYMSF